MRNRNLIPVERVTHILGFVVISPLSSSFFVIQTRMSTVMKLTSNGIFLTPDLSLKSYTDRILMSFSVINSASSHDDSGVKDETLKTRNGKWNHVFVLPCLVSAKSSDEKHEVLFFAWHLVVPERVIRTVKLLSFSDSFVLFKESIFCDPVHTFIAEIKKSKRNTRQRRDTAITEEIFHQSSFPLLTS